MIARQLFRTAAPLRQSIRRYATEAPSSSSNTPLIVGGAAIVGGIAAYSYFGSSSSAPTPLPKAEATKATAAPPKDAPMTFTGGDQGFVDLKLASVETVNHNTKRFRFELSEKHAVSGLHIASALLTKFQSPGMEKPVIRPYTPVSDEEDRGFLDLLVKVYPNGPMSEHLHSMAPGQLLSFKGPIPKYPWTPNKHSSITLIAGGTGITPMYQLIRAVFNNPEDKTKVTLVFGNVTEGDILLKKDFEKLENEHPNQFRAFYVVDKPPESWPYGKGHITKELLKTVLPGPDDKNAKVFVCGPPGLYMAISGGKKSPADQGELAGYLKELGYTKDQVYKF